VTSSSKFARTNGPVNSKVAAANYEPVRVSRKAAVAVFLLDHIGEWFDASVFNEVGGRAGDRRMRELRADGWKIETRRAAGNVYQHRLAKAPAKKVQTAYRQVVAA
jgi:hypothetical protein